LTRNIEILENYDDIISEIDLLIIAIPAQFIATSTPRFMDKLKP
jgi:glycerol-3-phosphate dehydrogenase